VDPLDPTVIAENELLSAANSIEAAAKKLAQLQPRLRPRVRVRRCLLVVLLNLVVGSRPSDHYFRSVCLFVCLSVCLFVCAEFFSAIFDPISIKLGHMLYVWV